MRYGRMETTNDEREGWMYGWMEKSQSDFWVIVYGIIGLTAKANDSLKLIAYGLKFNVKFCKTKFSK